MAKIVVVSADESRIQHVVGLIAQAANHVVQRAHAAPAQALARPELILGTDLMILQADRFSADDISQLRRLMSEQQSMQCMLLASDPSTELLMQAMRAGVLCVMPWPPAPQEFRDELQRCTGHALSSVRGEGQVLSFLSCKGGSGTTFVAANLAHALATRHGKRVLLVDLNQQYGDAAFLVTDQSPPATMADICRQVDRLDSTLLDACVTHVGPGFDVLPAAGDPVKAAEIKAAHVERVLALARPEYDVVVVDIGQDINPASIQVLDHSNLIYPVLQLDLAYLRAGHRLLDIFHPLGYHAERLRLVVNRHDKRTAIELPVMENAFGLRAAHVLPNDVRTVHESSAQGVPVLQLAEKSPIAKALLEMARQLCPDASATPRNLLSRLFGHGSRVPAAARA